MIRFQSKLLIGGKFSTGGGVASEGIVAYDPVTNSWSPAGQGVSGQLPSGSSVGVFTAAFARFPVGGSEKLVVGGAYLYGVNASGLKVANTNGIAAWSGTAWSSLAPTGWDPAQGNGNAVWTLTDWTPAGESRRLVIGGSYNAPTGTTARGICYFDSQTQSFKTFAAGDTGVAFADGSTANTSVSASIIHNGELYIAGRFERVNGVAASMIARWNRTTQQWQRVGPASGAGSLLPVFGSSGVSALAVFDDGSGYSLYAAGSFLSVGGTRTWVTRFDETLQQWTLVGGNATGFGTASSLAVFDDGNGPKLYLGTSSSFQPAGIYRLEQSGNWASVDGGVSATGGNFNSVYGLLADSDRLYVAGGFVSAGGDPAQNIAQFVGCPETCAADFNGDGFLDFTDFDAFVLAFEGGQVSADFNSDGFLDFTDFDAFVTAFEAGC